MPVRMLAISIAPNCKASLLVKATTLNPLAFLPILLREPKGFLSEKHPEVETSIATKASKIRLCFQRLFNTMVIFTPLPIDGLASISI